MADTPRFGLERITDAPLNPETAHNNAIMRIDMLLHLSVIDDDLTAPPGSPSEGDRYLPAATATGDWAGKENQVAYYQGAAWKFIAMASDTEGTFCYIEDEDIFKLWDGSAWVTPDTLTTLATDSFDANGSYLEAEAQEVADKIDTVIIALQKMGMAG